MARDLDQTSQYCRILADPTRIRLLRLLEQEAFSVAELAAITQLAQPRVSTHLGKLRDAGLVADRRSGVNVFYRIASDQQGNEALQLWQTLRDNTTDPLLTQDNERIPSVLSARTGAWADSVAGDMERHYSPGRTWEATAQALSHLISLGDVLDLASGDGVMAELLAPRADSILCLDASERVVEAGRKRLQGVGNVSFALGDMHHLESPDQSFDTVLLLHALTYTRQPGVVLKEAARVLKPGGFVLAMTLAKHAHERLVQPFDHQNLGFSVEKLKCLTEEARLKVGHCGITSRERKSPHFSVITLLATKP